jgi:hypothetical protein
MGDQRTNLDHGSVIRNRRHAGQSGNIDEMRRRALASGHLDYQIGTAGDEGAIAIEIQFETRRLVHRFGPVDPESHCTALNGRWPPARLH